MLPDLFGVRTLSSPHVQVCFNYQQSAQDNNMLVMEQLEPGVLWYNKDLDVAVLQLKTPRDGHAFPPGLGHHLEDVHQKLNFHMIGHSNGEYKAVNLCCEKRSSDQPDVQELRQVYSPYDFRAFVDPYKTLLEASMTYGASGSPCFDNLGNLVLMQTHSAVVNEVHLFNQAVNLIDVYRLMLQEKQELAVQLFGLRPELEQGNSTPLNSHFYFLSFLKLVLKLQQPLIAHRESATL